MPVLENYSAKDFNNGGGQFWTILQDQRGVMYFGNSSSNILEYDQLELGEPLGVGFAAGLPGVIHACTPPSRCHHAGD